MGKSWPFEHIETLKELVRMGLSLSEIGLAMGISSSAASGKIQRLRKLTGDDTLRAGLTSGRIGKSHDGGYHRVRKRTPQEIRAASRARWLEWQTRNPGAVVKAIDAAKRRAAMQRKEMRRMAMSNLSDFPNRVHLLDRQMDQCPWPLWGDGGSFYEDRFYCGNPAESWGHYCSAHMCQAHDVRLKGAFVTGVGRTANKWTVSTGGWRAA